MSTILMSIKPKYTEKIFDGSKKYEFRKHACKEEINEIIVYSSYPIKQVIGKLIIEKTIILPKKEMWNLTKNESGTTKENFFKYYKNQNYAVSFKIKEAIKYKEPKLLSEFNIKNAPQSFVYIRKD